MSVTPFITSTNSVHNGVFIYMITVEDSLPTPLQFIFTLEEMRENLEIRKILKNPLTILRQLVRQQ